ncbi:MAG: Mut7-C RNAse domain-containing protein [Pseudomonadota bacterium]
MRFVADCMLGKLAKWLRVMGLDTHYRTFYPCGTIEGLVKEGRRLLSRDRKKIDQYGNALLIHSNHVHAQLGEMAASGNLPINRSKWFSRCLLCNDTLKDVALEQAGENVPEYVFYNLISDIRCCASCGRYFWPGSHRQRMVDTLKEWGF